MIAVVLVGGEGTRLRPLTLDQPKPVLPIGGIPFVSLLLDRLAEAGVTRTVLSCGYLPDQLRAGIGAPPAGMVVDVVVEDEPLGTAGAIAFAAAGRVTGPFLALNGDVLGDADLGALVRAHLASGARASIGLTPVDDPTRYGVVVRDAAGRVERFVEKPPNADGLGPRPWWVNAGLYVLDPSVLELIPAGRMVSIEREVFPQLVGDGLLAFEDAGYWRDIGTFDSYRAANADAVSGRVRTRIGGSVDGIIIAPSAVVDSSAELIAPVLVGEHARVEAGATVGPGVVVGAGCTIGARATISDSVLLAGASVGASARVESSVLACAAIVGERATVMNCAFGTGAVVASGSSLTGERAAAHV